MSLFNRLVPSILAVAATYYSMNSAMAGVVAVKSDAGTITVPVVINNAITLDFMLDTGASSVVVPFSVFQTLVLAHTIEDSDLTGKQKVTMGDGAVADAWAFNIRSLKVGAHILTNVKGITLPGKEGTLLLGMSALSQMEPWSINSANGTFSFTEKHVPARNVGPSRKQEELVSARWRSAGDMPFASTGNDDTTVFAVFINTTDPAALGFCKGSIKSKGDLPVRVQVYSKDGGVTEGRAGVLSPATGTEHCWFSPIDKQLQFAMVRGDALSITYQLGNEQATLSVTLAGSEKALNEAFSRAPAEYATDEEISRVLAN